MSQIALISTNSCTELHILVAAFQNLSTSADQCSFTNFLQFLAHFSCATAPDGILDHSKRNDTVPSKKLLCIITILTPLQFPPNAYATPGTWKTKTLTAVLPTISCKRSSIDSFQVDYLWFECERITDGIVAHLTVDAHYSSLEHGDFNRFAYSVSANTARAETLRCLLAVENISSKD